MARLPELDPSALSEEQQRVHDAIASGPRGSARGPFAVWLRNPELADRIQQVGEYLRFHANLPDRLRELAILATARFFTAQFEWFAHRPIAEKSGLSPAIIEAIARREVPRFTDPDEELVYAVATTLHRVHELDDALYDRALARLGEARLVELVAVVGYYSLVALSLNAFRVDVPDGAPPLAP